MARILRLNLKSQYFYEIKSGKKPFEFRLTSNYWKKRLCGKEYDYVMFLLGYPPETDKGRQILMHYDGYQIQKVKHPHFSNKPVEVFAIRSDIKKQLVGGRIDA